MQSSDYLKRLTIIQKNLCAQECDINLLINNLSNSGINISKRQIYLDIEMIKEYLLNENQELIENLITKQKKTWKIIVKEESKFSDATAHKLLLLKDIIPLLLDDINIRQIIFKLASNSNINTTNFYRNEEQIVQKTNFFYKKNNEQYINTIIDIYNAIKTNKKITILKIILDVTCVFIHQTPIKISPISLIYHNGSMYVSGLTYKRKIIIFDVCQIVEFTTSIKSYNKQVSLMPILKKELSARFGVSENIDKNIYDIEIEFSSYTGEYLKQFHFHPTQSFKRTEHGYLLSLRCGINRELVSWLSYWMDNARILKPEMLIRIYLKQLNNIIRLNSSDTKLRYSNIFTREY